MTLPDQRWRQEAACRTMDPNDFHPIGWAGRSAKQVFGPEIHSAIAAAKAVCAVCPVRDACLDHALDTYEPEGLWGGLTPPERHKLRRRRRAMSA